MMPGRPAEHVPRHRADTIPLGVDLSTVTVEVGFAHDDGRECVFWHRERKWCTDATGVWSECLRVHPRRVPTFMADPPAPVGFRRASPPSGFRQTGSEGGCYS